MNARDENYASAIATAIETIVLTTIVSSSGSTPSFAARAGVGVVANRSGSGCNTVAAAQLALEHQQLQPAASGASECSGAEPSLQANVAGLHHFEGSLTCFPAPSSAQQPVSVLQARADCPKSESCEFLPCSCPIEGPHPISSESLRILASSMRESGLQRRGWPGTSQAIETRETE